MMGVAGGCIESLRFKHLSYLDLCDVHCGGLVFHENSPKKIVSFWSHESADSYWSHTLMMNFKIA